MSKGAPRARAPEGDTRAAEHSRQVTEARQAAAELRDATRDAHAAAKDIRKALRDAEGSPAEALKEHFETYLNKTLASLEGSLTQFTRASQENILARLSKTDTMLAGYLSVSTPQELMALWVALCADALDELIEVKYGELMRTSQAIDAAAAVARFEAGRDQNKLYAALRDAETPMPPLHGGDDE